MIKVNENETKVNLELIPYVPTIIRCYLSKEKVLKSELVF